MDNGEKSSFRFAFWKLEIQNKVLMVVGLYHPPTTYHAIDSNEVSVWNI